MSPFYFGAAVFSGIIALFVCDGVRRTWRRDDTRTRVTGLAVAIASVGWTIYFGRGGEPGWLPLGNWLLTLPAAWPHLREAFGPKRAGGTDTDGTASNSR